MKPFSDILVYAEVDDSNCLEQVVKVAAAHGAAITVCEVVPPAPRDTDSQGIVERVSKLRWTQAFRRLRRIVDHFSGHMVIDYSVFTGEALWVKEERLSLTGLSSAQMPPWPHH